jgi:hypothetical protein
MGFPGAFLIGSRGISVGKKNTTLQKSMGPYIYSIEMMVD